MTGTLVCFEGLDNSGKTTVINRIVEVLNFDEIPCKVFSFPNKSTLTFNVLQSYHQEFVDLHPKAAHLLYTANRWEVQEEIIKYLEQGYFVFLDRYFYSGVAYSCGYNKLDISWALKVEEGLVLPDVVFYFETDKEIRKSRFNIASDCGRFDTMKTQDAVEKVFKQLQTSTWTIVDANKSVDDICDFCCMQLTPFITR